MSDQLVAGLVRSLKARGLNVEIKDLPVQYLHLTRLADQVSIGGVKCQKAWLYAQLEADPQCTAILLAMQIRGLSAK